MQRAYPDPLPLPEEVGEARRERKSVAIRALWIGVALRLLVVFLEFSGYYYYGSLALLYDALASCLDILSSFVLLLFIALASRPPDGNHPFGHGRYEPLAGLLLSLFLAGVGVALFAWQFFSHLHGDHSSLGDAWLIPLLALLCLEVGYRLVIAAAKRCESPALQAEAWHFRLDAVSTIFAGVALFFAFLFPHRGHFFDILGALSIATLMVVVGLRALVKNMNQLLDHVPAESYMQVVRDAALLVPGVHATEKVGMQLYGPDAHVDIDIEVDPAMRVDEAHKISQQVRAEIQKALPQVRDVIVHIEPYYPGDH